MTGVRDTGRSPRTTRLIRGKATRVLSGTQTGTYTKRAMARDLLALGALVEAHRREFLIGACAIAAEGRDEPNPESDRAWAEDCLCDFEAEVLNDHAEQMDAA